VLLRQTGHQPRWRYFSLTQVNARRDGRPEGWAIWNGAQSEEAPGRSAFMAAEAARRQHRFDAMHEALLRARHEEGGDLEDPGVLRACAGLAGLDLERYEVDLADPDLLEAIRRDHQDAAERLHVFGTPTFVAPSGRSAYVRLSEVPEPSEADRYIARIEEMVDELPHLLEVKRPT
jgi:predicted DsbA family dithiol-disulfide isomerase